MAAQPDTAPKTIKKTFFYSFENVNYPSQIDRLKDDIYALKGVTEVKTEYKSEKAMGQVIVTVIEKSISKESDQEFDIKTLKGAIINNQLTPLTLTQEEVIIE